MPTWSAPPITCSESHDWRRLSHELTVLNPLGQVPLSKTRIRSLDSRGGPTQITMKTGYSDPFFDSLLDDHRQRQTPWGIGVSAERSGRARPRPTVVASSLRMVHTILKEGDDPHRTIRAGTDG